MDDDAAYGLEFLLAFDGRIHHLEGGYRLKFEIRRVEPSAQRPHGLMYSFTLHAPDGKRLVGFDNAHSVATGKGKRRLEIMDHWHRDENDRGRPYRFKDAETLIDDFFDEVERSLRERGASSVVLRTGDKEPQ